MTDTPAQDLRSALEPCPFCGSDTVQSAEFPWNPVMTRWAIFCVRGCETQGPPADTEAEAIAAWNRRTALAQPAENAKGGEVVAWMYRKPRRDMILTENRAENAIAADGWTETPLYAHPPAAEPVKLHDDWDKGAQALIKEAAALVQPSEGEAVFYIRVGGAHTSMNVKTKGQVDPDTALQNAIAALNGERSELSNCPVHNNPIGFNAAKADWNEELAGRPYSIDDWNQLTFGEQRSYALAAEPVGLREENARLKLDVAAQECLQDSAYKAGLAAGWNFAQDDDNDGFQRARSSTEHVAELKRIRSEREALDTVGRREVIKTFPEDTVNVQSRYVIVHQLRASADIQDAQTKAETKWADTSDRAELMRKAANTIEALATPARTDDAGQPSGDVAAMREALQPFADIAIWVEHTDLRDGNIVHRQRKTTGGYAELTKDHFRKAAQAIRALPIPTGKQSLQVEEKAAGVAPCMSKGDAYCLQDCKCAVWIDSPAAHADGREGGAFKRGDHVEKISGSKWRGTVVGEYSTRLTPEGYAVESDAEIGSVQIYPAKALRSTPPAALDEGEGK